MRAGGWDADSAWKQEKLEVSLSWWTVQGKILAVGAAESPPSSALSRRTSGTLCWAVL